MEIVITKCAFASLSTDDFKFRDVETVTRVLATELKAFLSDTNKHGKVIEITLVDPYGHVDHANLGIGAEEGFHVSTSWEAILQSGCSVVGIGCNKLFKSGGDKINNLVHKAVNNAGTGERLQELIRASYPGETPIIGKAYVVELEEDEPYRRQHGITHIVNVLGPNLNPNRLDCLPESERYRAGHLLALAYQAMFKAFADIVQSRNPTLKTMDKYVRKRPSIQMDHVVDPKHARSVSSLPFGEGDPAPSSSLPIPPYNHPNTRPPSVFPGLSLLGYLSRSPSAAFKPFIWFESEDKKHIVIYDGYPKAKFHALVLSRSRVLSRIKDATRDDLPALQEMHSVGRSITSSLNVECKIGYHALPSLTPLHLHVISKDMDSEKLNSAKHWNSFNHPRLFIPWSKVEDDLETKGRVEIDSEEILRELESARPRCHTCFFSPSGERNIRDALAVLKTHHCSPNDK